MATVVLQQLPTLQVRDRSATPSPRPGSIRLHTPRSATPIPNKHIPFCPPGPVPRSQTVTPPSSPPQISTTKGKSTYILQHPQDKGYKRLLRSPPVYEILGDQLAKAIDHAATQALPDPSLVFPWLHGLHPDNQTQLHFFAAKKRSQRRAPKCLRSITIIKAGGDLSCCRIKGAVAPDEIVSLADCDGGFLELDPPEGFSVRNFHIQASKAATISDVVIYGDDRTDQRVIRSVAERCSAVQRRRRRELEAQGQVAEHYHTFVLTQGFDDFADNHPEKVALNSYGRPTGHVLDLPQQERLEMCEMACASQIDQGVFQGPSPASLLIVNGEVSREKFDVLVECGDHASMPDAKLLTHKTQMLAESTGASEPVQIAFPSSGSISPATVNAAEGDGIIRMCRWIYDITHNFSSTQTNKNVPDPDGDIPMTEMVQPKKILLHCPDGYTETSLLCLAYYIFANNIPLHKAWIDLHTIRKRNFFAYGGDVAFLQALEPRLLAESPFASSKIAPSVTPSWLNKIDGSLPSKITDYMYLGNLVHANNPGMLKELGITRILSVGEPVSWTKQELADWPGGRHSIMFLDRVQDNGIDGLGHDLERALEFIAKGKAASTATLVHCRVGVSRSATICIAEVMASMNMSFPRAYCFVRARRLNVIIQPHLRFVYELMKWDELQQAKRGVTVRREMEWAEISREIANLNRPYSRT